MHDYVASAGHTGSTVVLSFVCWGHGAPGFRASARFLEVPVTTIPMSSSTEVAVVVGPLFSDAERAVLAGFLAGYSGQTRDAYTLDLSQYTSWCARQGLRLFTAKRADVECYARDLEARGRARATITR